MASVVLYPGELRWILPYRGFNIATNFQYVTEVLTPRAGPAYERRYQFRTNPQITLQYSFLQDASNALDVNGTISYSQSVDATEEGYQSWYVPVWSEGRPLGDIGLDGTGDSILVDLQGGNFATQLQVLIIDNTGRWYAASIDSTLVLGDYLLLYLDRIDPPITEVVMLNDAWVYPLVEATLNPAVGVNVGGRSHGKVSLDFTLTGSYWFPAITPDIVLLSAWHDTEYDVYLEPWLMNGDSLALSVSSKHDIADYDIAQRSIVTPWQTGTASFELTLESTTLAEQRALQGFIARRKGQFNPFVIPRYDIPLRVVSAGDDTIGSTLSLQLATNAEITNIGTFCNIYIKFANADYIVRSYVNSVSGSLEFEFESAVLYQKVKDIQGIYFMSLARLATDAVNVTYPHLQSAEVSMRCQILNSYVGFLDEYETP